MTIVNAAALLAAFLLSFPVFGANAQSADACRDAGDIAVLPSPVIPWKGAPLRVLFVAEKSLEGELSLIAPDGTVAAKSRERRGGPPYSWIAEVAAPAPGKWRVTLTRSGECPAITQEVEVKNDKPSPLAGTAGSIWPIRNAWNRATENLFSAWIEKLFDDPLDAAPSWPALHVVLRERSRNFLFNHLGIGEDEAGLVIRPDCADLPYFLRAYFAFKLGLPYGYSNCSRGGGGKPPRCPEWLSNQNPDAQKGSGLAATFGIFLKSVADTVHSGSARTSATDNNSDYYTVPLSQQSLRPGVSYADPYGHILMIVKRIAQTENNAGLFLAVDGQPDGTVARKRFWRGNFLFAQDPALGSPGFKRFRPVVRNKNGDVRKLTNEEIAKNPDYADYSLEQSKLGIEDFYDRMDDVMSPAPLEPLRAMKEAITSFEEQVKTRVTSVENGRKFQNSGKGEASMPDGPAIFETIGAWEDFSTPARDLRLLIALDVVRGFPDRVARRPNRYAIPDGKNVNEVRSELQSVLAAELANRKFSYPRSDGSQWTLALKDVADRAANFEMAYNPNDCVELRWGAASKSEEASTCKRSAPAAQRSKMTQYRVWFQERRRPPRA